MEHTATGVVTGSSRPAHNASHFSAWRACSEAASFPPLPGTLVPEMSLLSGACAKTTRVVLEVAGRAVIWGSVHLSLPQLAVRSTQGLSVWLLRRVEHSRFFQDLPAGEVQKAST